MSLFGDCLFNTKTVEAAYSDHWPRFIPQIVSKTDRKPIVRNDKLEPTYGKKSRRASNRYFRRCFYCCYFVKRKKANLSFHSFIHSINYSANILLSGARYQHQPEVRQIPDLVAFGGSRCYQRHALPFVTNFAKLICLWTKLGFFFLLAGHRKPPWGHRCELRKTCQSV